MPRALHGFQPKYGERAVLILSTDPLGAALLGALVETLDYNVRFASPRESPDDSFRQARPRVALIDAAYATGYADEVLGRAMMRGISVVIFGSAEACSRVRELALEHDFATLLMPPEVEELEQVLERGPESRSGKG